MSETQRLILEDAIEQYIKSEKRCLILQKNFKALFVMLMVLAFANLCLIFIIIGG